MEWVIRSSILIPPSIYQSTIFATTVRPRAPPNAEPFQDAVTNWKGRVEIPAPEAQRRCRYILTAAGEVDDRLHDLVALDPAGRFRLRSENFACEMRNFACEVKSFRKGPRKLLKSLANEITDFAASCDFKGLRPVLFRPYFVLGLFCPRAGRRKQVLVTGINY
jgi:hypothetical protein